MNLKLGDALLLLLASSASAEGLQQYEREADKWPIIQEVLRTTPFKSTFESEPPYCTRLLADLKTGTHIDVIEPEVRADSPDHPRLEKWNRCDDKDWGDAGIPVEAYTGLTALGKPPYRYYKTDVDANPGNELEDVLYHEDANIAHTIFGPGYDWVDLDGCLLKGRVDTVSAAWYPTPPPGRFTLNMLVQYYDDVLVLDLVDMYAKTDRDKKTPNYRLRLQRFTKKQPVVCSWKESTDTENKH